MIIYEMEIFGQRHQFHFRSVQERNQFVLGQRDRLDWTGQPLPDRPLAEVALFNDILKYKKQEK